MDTVFLSRNTYRFLFSLLAVVYIAGLFVPLMDNDSAHHANIALRMHLTGDYVSLVDYGKDYLDKPHLHFWLCAFSYKIFGVTTFAYKFPSLLFTIIGTWSTYRLGKALYNTETGKLAALIVASSLAYILANNDVRMDAILTSCIVLSTWQLVTFVQHKKLLNVLGAALGLALGFSTKGHIAVFVPAVAILFYILYRKEWKVLLNWKWLLMIVLFGLFILPVVYCYYLQYNLHPEKVVRGKDHIDGVRFILVNQSVERFTGEMGNDGKNDYFFFIHSFLWAFAPWSVLAFIAVVSRTRHFLRRKEEWLTIGVFLTLLLVVSFSGFKLPHYLNIVFPTTAVLTASFLLGSAFTQKQIILIYRLQLFMIVLLFMVVGLITLWAFPVKNFYVIPGIVLFLAAFFYFLRKPNFTPLQKAVCCSAAGMALCFFLLNSNFYPQLLKYQAGKELATASKDRVDPNDVYFWQETYSSSYNFYSKSLRKPFTDTSVQPGRKSWLLFDIIHEKAITDAGYKLGDRFSAIDFEITRLNIKFINPARREGECSQFVIAEISR